MYDPQTMVTGICSFNPAALVGVNVTSLRPRLEHAQIMTKTDMARLGRLGGVTQLLRFNKS